MYNQLYNTNTLNFSFLSYNAIQQYDKYVYFFT